MEGRWRHHIVSAAFFQAGLELSHEDSVKLWTDNSILEGDRADCFFYESSTNIRSGKTFKSKLGSRAAIAKSGLNASAVYLGGGSMPDVNEPEQSTYDFLFYQELCDRFLNGHEPRPAHFMSSFSDELVQQTDSADVLMLLLDRFGIFDKSHCVHGFVEVCQKDLNCAGLAYTSTIMAGMPLSVMIRRHKWLKQGWLSGKAVYGLHWGNYFGKSILDQIGGKTSFFNDYKAFATDQDGTPNALAVEFGAGVFCSLTSKISECAPGSHIFLNVEDNLDWLMNRLDEGGVEVI